MLLNQKVKILYFILKAKQYILALVLKQSGSNINLFIFKKTKSSCVSKA